MLKWAHQSPLTPVEVLEADEIYYGPGTYFADFERERFALDKYYGGMPALPPHLAAQVYAQSVVNWHVPLIQTFSPPIITVSDTAGNTSGNYTVNNSSVSYTL